MDIQLALLSSVINEGVSAYRNLQKSGIDLTQFSGQAKELYEFISDYYLDYKQLPSREVIKAKLDIEVDFLTEPSDFFIKEFRAAKLHNFWQEQLLKIIQSQDSRKPYRTQELIEDALSKIKEMNMAPSAVEEMGELGIEAFNVYEALERNETGILTPWKTINNISRGFWPQDLIIFAARSGTGKTILMLLLALYAFDVQKKKILFISPEMPKERLALRAYALKYKLPYGKLLEGELTPSQRQKFWEGVESARQSTGFGVVSSKNFDYSISSLAAAISYYKPDVVYIDGVYLLKAHGINRNEQAANLMNEVKRLAIRFNIPIVISTQFNKSVSNEKSSTVKDTGIAMTDVANWNNSLAIGLARDVDLESQNLMEMVVLKVRDGKKPGSPIICNWNFETMDFSEKDLTKKDKEKESITDPFENFSHTGVSGIEVPEIPDSVKETDLPF